ANARRELDCARSPQRFGHVTLLLTVPNTSKIGAFTSVTSIWHTPLFPSRQTGAAFAVRSTRSVGQGSDRQWQSARDDTAARRAFQTSRGTRVLTRLCP